MVKSISPVRYESVFIVIDGIVFLLLLAPIIIIAVTTNRINECQHGPQNEQRRWKKKINRLLRGVDRVGDFIAVVVVIDASSRPSGRLVIRLVIGQTNVPQNAALRRIHNMQHVLALRLG